MGKKFFNKNNQASKSGNFGPKQQTNFKAKFKPPGKNQAGKSGGNFGPKQQNNNYKAKFTPPGKNQAAKSGNFGPKQQNNYKAKFTPPGKNQSGGGGGFNKNKPGSGGFMKSPPKANKQNAGSLKRKLAEVKTPPTPQSTVKKEQKEKLKFDSDDSSDEDEELDDEEMGLSDEEMSEMEDEMESGEESDEEESMTLPPKANKQNAESLKRKLAEVKTPPTPQSAVKKEQKEKLKFDSDDSSDAPPKTNKQNAESLKRKLAESKTPPTPQSAVKKEQKEKLKFDSDDSSDEDEEELDDEEMGLSDEEMSGMEDEMESGEESDEEESMTSPPKANKQNEESLKRKLADLKTPPTPQSAVKKARLEEGGERAVKVEEKSTPKTKAEKKEAKKTEYEEHKQNIPKLSDEQAKAIAAEENRRRQERDKRTLFLRCETFTLMSPGDMKALHPDVVSVRNNHKLCWLIFPSESSAAKAHLALSKKDALSGKELFVDFCGANSKNPSKVKPDKNANKPINPLELLLTHLPKATTEEQLRVVFPTATRVRFPGANKSPGKTRRKTGGPKMAFVKFETPAEAKKVFEKYGNQAMLKIGGELVDLHYSRMMN